VNDKRTKNSGVMIVAFAAVAAWQIYDMATATETPSRALTILQYVLLVGLLIGFIGAVLNFLRSQ
jgi:phosphate starvation-inducible membrane PsiE